MSLLEADSITLSFNGIKILSDIYLNCSSGEVVGLVGRNGAGKSCLMKIIFGSLRGENQCVRMDGKFYHQLLTEPGAVNYLSQNSFLLDYLTLNELIRIFRLDPEVLSITELRGIEAVKLGRLSYGQKRLVEIVTILFAPVKFSLLDEPFSFLAPRLVETIIPLVRMQAKKKGIILSDHQYTSVLESCDRFYMLNDGSIRVMKNQSDLEKCGYLPSKSEAVEDTE